MAIFQSMKGVIKCDAYEKEIGTIKGPKQIFDVWAEWGSRAETRCIDCSEKPIAPHTKD